MKPIYVEDVIYEFLSYQKKDYGTFNNVLKAILRKLGNLQEQVELLECKIEGKEKYVEGILLESVRNPQVVSSYSGNKTMNVLPSGPPKAQPLPKGGFQKDLQKVFNVFKGKQVKPSDFLKVQETVDFEEPKKLNPPPKVPQKPESDES